MDPKALQWAQANPSDPRSKQIMMRDWAEKNPNDSRSAQIMQKLQGGSQKPAGNISSPQFDNPTQGNQGSNPGSVTQNNQSNFSKIASFVGGIPEAIQHAPDIVPGLKERRLAIEKARGPQQNLPDTGMNDPAYQAMGLMSPSSVLSLAKYIPGVKGLLGRGAQRAAVMDMVKNEATLGPAVSEGLGDAEKIFNAKQITPRMAEQRQLIEGKTVKFDPESLKGIDPALDAQLESMKMYQPDPYGVHTRTGAFSTGKPGVEAVPGQRTVVTHGYAGEAPKAPENFGYPTEGNGIRPPVAEPVAKPFSEVSSPGTPGEAPVAGGKVPFETPSRPYYSEGEVPAADLMKLRAKLNELSQFKPGALYSEEATAKAQKAREAGDMIRAKLNDLHPDMARLSDEMQHYSKLRDTVLTPGDKRPISAIEAPVGSDKASNLSQFDEAAGTRLRQIGQDVSTAKSRLGQDPSIPLNKYSALQKLFGYGPRAFDATAQELLRPQSAWSMIPPKVPASLVNTEDQ